MEHNAALFVLCKQAAQYSVGVFCPHILKQLFDTCYEEIFMNMLSGAKWDIQYFLHLSVCRYM